MKSEETDEQSDALEYDMPATKLPHEFTGHGLEIIGNPACPDGEVTVMFNDGRFSSIGLPIRTLHDPVAYHAPDLRTRSWLDYRARRLAEDIRRGHGTAAMEAELSKILSVCRHAKPRQQKTERAVAAIRKGDFSPRWACQNRLQQGALDSLRLLCEENHRPPTEREMIYAMKAGTDDEGERWTVDGDDKSLSDFLRTHGFSWLPHSRRGYQGERG